MKQIFIGLSGLLLVIFAAGCSSLKHKTERTIASSTTATTAEAANTIEEITSGHEFKYCTACNYSELHVSEAIQFFEVNKQASTQVLEGTKTLSSGQQIPVTCETSYSVERLREKYSSLAWGHLRCSDEKSYVFLQTLRDVHQGISVKRISQGVVIAREHDRGTKFGHWITLPRERAYLIADPTNFSLKRIVISAPENDNPMNEKRTIYDLYLR